jgi:hypothetical protein
MATKTKPERANRKVSQIVNTPNKGRLVVRRQMTLKLDTKGSRRPLWYVDEALGHTVPTFRFPFTSIAKADGRALHTREISVRIYADAGANSPHRTVRLDAEEEKALARGDPAMEERLVRESAIGRKFDELVELLQLAILTGLPSKEDGMGDWSYEIVCK